MYKKFRIKMVETLIKNSAPEGRHLTFIVWEINSYVSDNFNTILFHVPLSFQLLSLFFVQH